MTRVKLVLEYDGTNYVGWQLQPNGPSVQGRVQMALGELLGQPIQVMAAGRTDSGVHAKGQVIAFDSPRQLPMKAYWMGLNGLLPDDIAVVKAEEVRDDFDPRRWSQGKRYRYSISNRRTRSPHRRFTHWEIFQPIDLDAMQIASRVLLGRHDFSAFRAEGCQAKTAERELKKIDIGGLPGDELHLVFEGTAFLRHMVRNLVGTLIEVGRKRQPTEWVREVLASRDRSRAGATAPPQGLCLEEVFYGAGPRDEKHDDDD
jgi:tRNA pseudouridine38-40 synthase